MEDKRGASSRYYSLIKGREPFLHSDILLRIDP